MHVDVRLESQLERTDFVVVRIVRRASGLELGALPLSDARNPQAVMDTVVVALAVEGYTYCCTLADLVPMGLACIDSSAYLRRRTVRHFGLGLVLPGPFAC